MKKIYFLLDGTIDIVGFFKEYNEILEKNASTGLSPEANIDPKKLVPDCYKDLDSIYIRDDQLLKYECYQQCYHEGDRQIKVDVNWERNLMPPKIIAKRYRDKLSTPEEKALTRLFSEKDWYEKALIGLDQRVLKGESDKPKIRQKLLTKIEILAQKKQENHD